MLVEDLIRLLQQFDQKSEVAIARVKNWDIVFAHDVTIVFDENCYPVIIPKDDVKEFLRNKFVEAT